MGYGVSMIGNAVTPGAEWLRGISQYSREQRAAGRPASTIGLRDWHLRRLGVDLGGSPWTVTRADLVEWIAARDWSPASKRAARSSLRSFYSWARAAGHIASDPAADLPRVSATRGMPRPAPVDVIASAARRASDPRAALMIDILATTGLRRGELCAIHSRDVTSDEHGHALRVLGKGQRVRIVPIPGRVARAIARADGYLFPGQIDGHLSARRCGEIVSDALPAGYTAHTIRHAYATRVYAASHNIRAVQELLGHARLDTTMIYTAVSADERRAAAASVWGAAA